MKTYASLTAAERAEIVRQFEAYKEIAGPSANPIHGAAVVASGHLLHGDNHLWNGKSGSNAYAIVLLASMEHGLSYREGDEWWPQISSVLEALGRRINRP